MRPININIAIMPRRVASHDRIIATIRKEVHAGEVAVGADDAVRIDKSFDAGIVIA